MTQPQTHDYNGHMVCHNCGMTWEFRDSPCSPQTPNLSKCHNAPTYVHSSNEGTSCYICTSCKEPCDLGVLNPAGHNLTDSNSRQIVSIDLPEQADQRFADALDKILDYDLWNEVFNTTPSYGTSAYSKRKHKALTKAKASILAAFAAELRSIMPTLPMPKINGSAIGKSYAMDGYQMAITAMEHNAKERGVL